MENPFLIKEPKYFYSYLDEELFFDWLVKIFGKNSFRRSGAYLEIVLPTTISEQNLRDLIALMMRYNLDMGCLAKFCTEENTIWFKNSDSYWYEKIFGNQSR